MEVCQGPPMVQPRHLNFAPSLETVQVIYCWTGSAPCLRRMPLNIDQKPKRIVGEEVTWSDVDGCKTRLKLRCMNASEQAANEEAK